jgi:hypothetical protein
MLRRDGSLRLEDDHRFGRQAALTALDDEEILEGVTLDRSA